MAEDFVYISRARLEMKNRMRHAYLGDVAEPVVYGMQGTLQEYYGVPAGTPPSASTLDHIIAAVAG